MQLFNYNFGVQVRQTTVSKTYSHPLEVEFFAIGEEIDGDNYVLLDRQKNSFVPTEYNGKTFEFRGNDVGLRKMAYRDTAPVRGTKYGGYLVTVSDKNGRIVTYKASHEFLFKNLTRLKKLPINFHFNRECRRTMPARPTSDSRGPGAVDGK